MYKSVEKWGTTGVATMSQGDMWQTGRVWHRNARDPGHSHDHYTVTLSLGTMGSYLKYLTRYKPITLSARVDTTTDLYFVVLLYDVIEISYL